MKVDFYSQIKRKTTFNEKLVVDIIKQASRFLKIKNNFELTVLLVGDVKIKSLNKLYRKKDKVTDVLSFSQQEGQALVLPQKKNNYLGEIFICYPQLLRQAKKLGHSNKLEFSFLLIHGFLHLLGYDHQKDKDYIKMKKIQDQILTKIYGA